MSEETMKLSIHDWFKWWLFDKALAYCVRCVHPDADPSEFSLIDNTNFIAVSKDEVKEIMEEEPELAWRFEGLLTHA